MFPHPFFLVDHDAVHDGDLTRRPAEAERGDASPYPDGIVERQDFPRGHNVVILRKVSHHAITSC